MKRQAVTAAVRFIIVCLPRDCTADQRGGLIESGALCYTERQPDDDNRSTVERTMLPEKLKRDERFQVQRLPRWIFAGVGGAALLIVLLSLPSGDRGAVTSRRDGDYIIAEMPSPQMNFTAGAQPDLLIGWSYTETSQRRSDVTGETFAVWQRETVCYDCGSTDKIIAYFDEAFVSEDGWTKRDGACPLAQDAGLIVLPDAAAEGVQAYTPPRDLSRFAEACVLILPVTLTGSDDRAVFRVRLLTVNPT